MAELRILVDPTEELRRYMGECGGADVTDPWALGRLSVGLEVETQRRMIEGIVGNSLLHLSSQEICTVLHSVLVRAELWDEVQLWYERLCDWREARRVRFEATNVSDGRVSDDRSAGSSVPANLSATRLPPSCSD